MSNILNYQVGQVPLDAVLIQVRNSDNSLKNCTMYDSVDVQVIGTDNEIVDMSNAELVVAQAQVGEFRLRWPARHSIFNKSGVYLLQLVLTTNSGYRDVTSVAEIRVRDPRGGRY